VASLRRDLGRAAREADSEQSRARVQALRAAFPDPATYPRPLPQGRWYHLAATWESRGATGALRLSANGRFVAAKQGAWQEWTPADTVYVGRRRHAGGAFAGRIDELRVSSAARPAFDCERPPQQDAETTLLAHYDRIGELGADFSAGAPGAVKLPNPYTPCRMASEGRFGACLSVSEQPTFQRFDALAYSSAGVFGPRAGSVEMWICPDPAARSVANGTLVDGGGLQLSAANNVVRFEVAGLAATFDLAALRDGAR